MKFLRFFILLATAGLLFTACQKEFSFENGLAEGVLVKDVNGDCAPILVNGNFGTDTALNANNFIEVQLNITKPGTYFIKTDTVNGYSFSGSGITTVAGANTVRLSGAGRPLAQQVDVFTVKFDTTSCTVNVLVDATGGGGSTPPSGGGGTTPAEFTFVKSGDSCSAVIISGSYNKGLKTSSSNTVRMNVNITKAGPYLISTAVVNGVSFSMDGSFIGNGNLPVTLVANGGTPIDTGKFVYNVTAGSNTCSFTITYGAPIPPASYTLECGNVSYSGTYQAGQAMTSNNTATVTINASVAGDYSITSNEVNGITFSGSGNIPMPGIVPITLNATGTPIAAGDFNYTLTGDGGATCTISRNYTPPPPPTSFTFDCATASFTGNYQAGVAMTTANKLTLTVNVTSIGNFIIASTISNGVSFSLSGTFTNTGMQNIVLNAAGTPTASGDFMNSLRSNQSTSACDVTVMYSAAPPKPQGIFRAKLDGVLTDFNLNNNASGFIAFPNSLSVAGDGLNNIRFSLSVRTDNTQNPRPITPGTYINNLNDNISRNYFIGATYTDAAGVLWTPRGYFDPTVPPDNFTIIITQVTASKVVGTFSGVVRINLAQGPTTINVTEGVFDVVIE